MCGLTSANFTSKQIKLIRKYLKLRIMEDNVTFRGHEQEWNHVHDLMKRTVLQGEAHSALLIGPRGSGKTTLVNSVLHRLAKEADLANDAVIVKLNGYMHQDDKVALKSITAQMQLENAVGDRVFGTFAENLSFLLSCLRSADQRSRSMVFILEEFHAFCHSTRAQTLLYNLFDITHARQAPMCVLGITNRLDVMETLEKRVKSRFSHRHMFIFPGEQATLLDTLVELLSVPTVVEKVKKRARKKSVGKCDVTETLEKRVMSRFSHRHMFIFPGEQATLLDALVELLSVPAVVEKVKKRARKKSVGKCDVTETLEKRVMSRFSHRHMFIFPGEQATLLDALVELLSVPAVVENVKKRARKKSAGKCDVTETLEKRVMSRFSHRHMFIFPGEQATLLDALVELLSVPAVVEKVKKRARKKSAGKCDVTETLEKRVMSRFSHRHMFIFPGEQATLLDALVELLSVPAVVEKVKKRARKKSAGKCDVTETLEKRIMSRFSHRHMFTFPGEQATLLDALVELLLVPAVVEKVKKRARKKSVASEPMDIDGTTNSIPIEVLQRCRVDPQEFTALDQGFVEDWNAHILALRSDENVVDAFEKLCYYTNNEQIFKDILFQVVCTLSPAKPYIEAADFSSTIDRTVAPEHKVKLLQSLSILELSLVIAMRHGMDIFDGQPMNFEMVLHRYTKFASANSSTQTVPRPVILKAFEHLQALELLVPVRGSDSIYASSETTASRVQKEYQLFTLAAEGLNEAVAGFKALPTEISHWLNTGDL